jgi:hypothetical protein
LLLVTVLSGVVLGAFYSAAAPLDSLERIEAGLPWVWLVRGTHWMAATGLLVLGAVHLFEMVRQGREHALSRAVWWRSVLLLPLLLLAMLGGFVLRGDAEAVSALSVWRALTTSVPLVGGALDRLLIGAGVSDLSVVLLHHAGTFTLAIWLLSGEHGGRFWPDGRWGVVAAGVALALAAVVPIGLGAPPGELGTSGAVQLGPWYLLGLQGLLLDLPVAVGWLAPLLLLVLVGSLAHVEGRARRALLIAVVALIVLYLAWSVRLLLYARGVGV